MSFPSRTSGSNDCVERSIYINRQGVKSALDSWLMGKLNSVSYPVDQKIDNQINSLLPNEASLPADRVFDMIPNVSILKALRTALSDLMLVNINKSQEQT